MSRHNKYDVHKVGQLTDHTQSHFGQPTDHTQSHFGQPTDHTQSHFGQPTDHTQSHVDAFITMTIMLMTITQFINVTIILQLVRFCHTARLLSDQLTAEVECVIDGRTDKQTDIGWLVGPGAVASHCLATRLQLCIDDVHWTLHVAVHTTEQQLLLLLLLIDRFLSRHRS